MVTMARDWTRRILLWTPWALLGLGAPLVVYWMTEPPPVQINYVAPAFLSEPANSREEAAQHYVAEALGGTTLWRYIEYCVTRPYQGTSHRSWVGNALVWHAPDLPTQFSRVPGCASLSIAVDVPQSNPSRDFAFVQRMEIELNPLRTVELEYPPIPLRILAPNGCGK